jgi:hypothetical protein
MVTTQPGSLYNPIIGGLNTQQVDLSTISKPFADFVNNLDVNQGGYADAKPL